jgi:protein-disulfide isomerase
MYTRMRVLSVIMFALVPAACARKSAPAREADPAATYALDVSRDPFVGPADALVTVVKAHDYACPFSAKAEPTMARLLAKYSGKLRVVYKDLVTRPDESMPAHQAACAAAKQGKFAEMNAAIWERSFAKDASEDMMLALARDLGLNEASFVKDLHGNECKQGIEDDMRALANVGGHGTPTFYVNGGHTSGARPLADFERLVNEELAKAEARVGKDGITAANYYERVVVGEGRKSL